MSRLRCAPVAAQGEAEARRTAVAGLVGALGQIVAEIRRLEPEIAGAVRSHPDGEVFLSFFRDPKSVLTAAGAIHILGRAWTQVLGRCWQDGVPYDPALQGNLRRLQPAEG